MAVPAGEAPEAIVEHADVVVVCNVVTSAIVELSNCGPPLVILDQAMPWYHAEDWNTHHWHHVSSVQTLERELEAMFENHGLWRKRAEQTRLASHAYLGETPESSVARCLEVIHELAEPAPGSGPSFAETCQRRRRRSSAARS